MGPHSNRTMSWLLFILALPILRVWALTLDVDDQDSILSAASTVAHGLTSLYNGNQTGGVLGKFPYPPYYWWESGAAWGALVNYWHYTGDSSFNNLVHTALLSQLSSTNDFMPPAEEFDEGNDDQAFWVFASLSAAEYGFPEPGSSYPSWLTISENAFNDFVSRWNSSTCGGGLKWQIYSSNSGYDYRNSISNGGFFQVSARLARLTGNQTYVEWANKIWNWTTEIGLMDDSYSVYDGTSDTTNCSSIDHLQWTYNVGVFLYGAAVMQNYTNGDQAWVERTDGLMSAAKTFLSPYSNATDILYEAECEKAADCDTDQISMKGYLARWLAGTSVMAPSTAGRVGTILKASAAGAALACSGDNNSTCGQKWYVGGWDGSSGMGQELAALEVMYSLLANSTSPPSAANSTTSSSNSSSTSTSSASVTTSASAVESSSGTSSDSAAFLAEASGTSSTLQNTTSSSTSSMPSSDASSSLSQVASTKTETGYSASNTSAGTAASPVIDAGATSTTQASTVQGSATIAPYTGLGPRKANVDLYLCGVAIMMSCLL